MRGMFFIGGLPRSGSTLLSALLNQNPLIHAEPSSGLLDLLGHVEAELVQSEQARAFPNPQRVFDVCRQIPKSFYASVDKPYVVDKNRTWTAGTAYRIASQYIEPAPKIVCCVRPVLEILASYIDLCHRNGSGGFMDAMINENQFGGPLDDDRCEVLMMPGGRVRHNLICLKAILTSPVAHNALLIEYDDLVSDTQATMDRIYEFWGLPAFQHFPQVEEVFPVDDSVYGLRGLHDIRPEISKRAIDPKEVLSPNVIRRYSGLDFWRRDTVC